MSASPRTYARTSDVIQEDVGGEVVLLHTQNWNYFEFDKVGEAIWSLLAEPRSLTALVGALMTQFEVEEAQCARDTEQFLAQLMEQGLVVANEV